MLARLGASDFFGEMALLTGKPRSTAARAAVHTNLWVLYRSDFEDLVNRHPAISLTLSKALSQRLADMDRRFTENHLRGLGLLTGLSSSQLEEISRKMKPVRYRQGEVILQEGDSGDEMYFIESGQVQVVRGRGSAAYDPGRAGRGRPLWRDGAAYRQSPVGDRHGADRRGPVADVPGQFRRSGNHLPEPGPGAEPVVE